MIGSEEMITVEKIIEHMKLTEHMQDMTNPYYKGYVQALNEVGIVLKEDEARKKAMDEDKEVKQ